MGNNHVNQLNESFYYDKDDLGCVFDGEKYRFKVWSPICESMDICIYEGNKLEPEKYQMNKEESGVWSLDFDLSVEGKYYTFNAKIDGVEREAVDPYAKLVSINGEKALILDMEKTNPDLWNETKVIKCESNTDAIIYELSIRDISIDKNSGIDEKGRFLGLAKENTIGIDEIKTGLNHIKDLGVTHIQIMPIYDFASIDEKNTCINGEFENSRDYNWGYDPQNYNAVEGSYSSNPYNPVTRVREFKELIKAIHNNGIGVIMDVVYNHMYEVEKSSFHKLMPGYFFRYDENGKLVDESGCGNALASEKIMVRKFIVDSVKYWAKEYKLDGFRFDLMGLLDVETMNQISSELKKINKDIIIIGEGWNMGSTLDESEKAIQKNAYKMKDIAFFNDSARDGLRGEAFVEGDKGFLNFGRDKELEIKKAIVGGIRYSDYIETWGLVEPKQVVNYVECHDNHTLFDKLKLVENDEKKIKQMCRLGTSIVLLSQGIPFLHSGQEFFRTKHGIENSYNSNDTINKIDWIRKLENLENVEYIKGLIKLRKKYDCFRLRSSEDIKEKLAFMHTSENYVAYRIIDKDKKIIVVHNASENEECIEFNKTFDFEILVDKNIAGIDSIKNINNNKLRVEKCSTLVAIIK